MLLRDRRTILTVILTTSLVVGLAACKPEERNRVLLYTKGEYQGKADDPIGSDVLQSLAARAEGQRSPQGSAPANAYAAGFTPLAPVNTDRMRQQSGPTTTTPRGAAGGGLQNVSTTDRARMQMDPAGQAPGAGSLRAPLATGQDAVETDGKPSATGPQGDRAPLLNRAQRQNLENRLKGMTNF